VLVAVVGVGCEAVLPVRSPVLQPEVAACQPERDMSPADVPLLEPVVGIDRGGTGVMLLVASVPGVDDLLYMTACRFERVGQNVFSSGGSGGTNERAVHGVISIDRTFDTDGPRPEAVAAGRVSTEVASVVVVTEDGATIDAATENGYWLAWWPLGSAGAEVRALDGNGRQIGSASPVNAEAPQPSP
jgi:hypothetical protein